MKNSHTAESDNSKEQSEKEINRVKQVEAALKAESLFDETEKAKAETLSPPSKIKSGGWFAKPPVRKDYVPPAPTAYPMRVPKDFHQTWPINTANGEGVVYTIDVTHPAEQEAKLYAVYPDVQAEALRLCLAGDFTFGILTDKNSNWGGEVRWMELHPWVTKAGQFGLMQIRGPLDGNTLSEDAYRVKRGNVDDHQGKWVRRTTIARQQVVVPLPDGADLGVPRWPKVLTDGDWETIINRAFDNRYIRSLDDKTAKYLAGLE